MATIFNVSGGGVSVRVTVTQIANGDLRVDLAVLPGTNIGDLRALFFDVSDESLLPGLTVTDLSGVITEVQKNADGVSNLGNGANINGPGPDAYDVGLELGTAGIGGDDIRTVSLVLSHPTADLSADFLGGENVAIRLTSVGPEGGSRGASLKLTGSVPEPEPEPAAPDFTIDKIVTAIDAGADGILNAAGEAIGYDIVVTNTGGVALTGVTIVDPLTGLSTTVASLAPGASHVVGTSYTLTQADLDGNGGGDGDIDNTATADTDQTGPKSDTTETPVVRAPGLDLTKTADRASVTAAGETIVYTYAVKNTGNVTLTGVTLSDDAFTAGDPADDFAPAYVRGDRDSDGALDVGETWRFTASHTVTAAEIAAGKPLVNVATADSDQTRPDTDDATVVVEPAKDRCTDVDDEFDRAGAIKNPTFTFGKDGQHTNGTNGDDVVVGDGKANTISVNEGRNVVAAGGGNDIVNGGNGTDEIYGDDGSDILNGNGGNDKLSGGKGHDKIYGGGGNDIISTGVGNDLVEGGDGKDRINAGAGNDTVQGEGGNDCIAGGKDNGSIAKTPNGLEVTLGDELFGNGGADQFDFHKGDGVDFLFDFKASDGDRLSFLGIDAAEAEFVQGNTPYGPAAGIVFDLDDDGQYDGGVFFQQVREFAEFTALIENGHIDFA